MIVAPGSLFTRPRFSSDARFLIAPQMLDESVRETFWAWTQMVQQLVGSPQKMQQLVRGSGERQ